MSTHEIDIVKAGKEASERIAKLTPKQIKNINKFVDRMLVIEGEEAIKRGDLGYLARALVMATMPHSKPKSNEFERKNGNYTLSMIAPSKMGLPYGVYPRLLMAWINTEAVKTKSRHLILGQSLSGFMAKLDLVPTGGRWGTITRLKSQINKLFSTSIYASYDTENQTKIKNFNIISEADLWWEPKEPDQIMLFESSVVLGEAFYKEIINNPVPIDIEALKALKSSALALDIYMWLTYRMHNLKSIQHISWETLMLQFGSDYKEVKHFKAEFKKQLKKVQLIYSDVKIDASGRKTLLLKPSPTHIKKLNKELTKQC